MAQKLAEKLGVDTVTVWKIALNLLGWLLMGVWMTAKISAGFDYIKQDMSNMRSDIHTISQRLDRHIDETK